MVSDEGSGGLTVARPDFIRSLRQFLPVRPYPCCPTNLESSRRGVPAGCLSIPCRYVHSPSEMVDLNDVQNGVRLMLALLSAPVQLD